MYLETPELPRAASRPTGRRSPRWPGPPAPRRWSASTRSVARRSGPAGGLGADIVVGTHPAAGRPPERRRRRRRVHRHPRRGALRAGVPDPAGEHRATPSSPGERAFGDDAVPADLLRLARGRQRLDRQLGLPVDRRQRGVHGAAGAAGVRRARRDDPAATATTRRAGWPRSPASRCAGPRASSRSSWSTSTAPASTVAEINAALRGRGIFGGKDLSPTSPSSASRALYCVTELHTARGHRPARRTL